MYGWLVFLLAWVSVMLGMILRNTNGEKMVVGMSWFPLFLLQTKQRTSLWYHKETCFSFLKIKHYTLSIIYRCKGYIFFQRLHMWLQKEMYRSVRCGSCLWQVQIMPLTSANHVFNKYESCFWKLHSMPFYLTFSTITRNIISFF